MNIINNCITKAEV